MNGLEAFGLYLAGIVTHILWQTVKDCKRIILAGEALEQEQTPLAADVERYQQETCPGCGGMGWHNIIVEDGNERLCPVQEAEFILRGWHVIWE